MNGKRHVVLAAITVAAVAALIVPAPAEAHVEIQEGEAELVKEVLQALWENGLAWYDEAGWQINLWTGQNNWREAYWPVLSGVANGVVDSFQALKELLLRNGFVQDLGITSHVSLNRPIDCQPPMPPESFDVGDEENGDSDKNGNGGVPPGGGEEPARRPETEEGSKQQVGDYSVPILVEDLLPVLQLGLVILIVAGGLWLVGSALSAVFGLA